MMMMMMMMMILNPESKYNFNIQGSPLISIIIIINGYITSIQWQRHETRTERLNVQIKLKPSL
jgi:hypothetical protein